MNMMDEVYYSFGYFCPGPTQVDPYWKTDFPFCDGVEPFQLTSVEPADEEYIKTLGGFAAKTGTKLILSVGGWNFPSAFFSDMASTKESRGVFIKSCQDFMEKNNFQGIDIDWEYPCSGPREDPIKITCDFFQVTQDEGGDCDKDADNLLLLVQEMREAFGPDKMITVASQAGMDNALKGFHLVEMAEVIDQFNLMSYDYSVSDIDSAKWTAPNMPLYDVKGVENVPEWGMNYTVQGYLAAGVPAEKMSLGVAMYSHAWYVPGLTGDEWKNFGLEATKQEACCGPFKDTYGALYGRSSHLCGTMMLSEIQDAACERYHHEESNSDIMYCLEDSADGWTKAGTWVSYNDVDSYAAIANYAVDMGLKGLFLFDTSMDTRNEAGEFAFELTDMMYTIVKGEAPSTDDIPYGDDSAPIGDNCEGRVAGNYCSEESTKFFSCPGNFEQSCPGGLVCKASGDSQVFCDWPTETAVIA